MAALVLRVEGEMIAIIGDFNRDVRPPEFLDLTNERPIKFDLSALGSFNSMANRSLFWLHQEVGDGGMEFYECPWFFCVNILTMPTFSKAIRTAYVPLRCPDCDSENQVLIEFAKALTDLGIEITPRQCDQCPSFLKIDAEAEEILISGI